VTIKRTPTEGEKMDRLMKMLDELKVTVKEASELIEIFSATEEGSMFSMADVKLVITSMRNKA
jgi:hypothetical protein